ncbi:MAG: hypothetical protein WB783_08235 [Arenicellales bacterium]
MHAHRYNINAARQRLAFCLNTGIGESSSTAATGSEQAAFEQLH